MKIQVTPNDERTRFLLVEAIFNGFHACIYRGGLEILNEHTEEDEEHLWDKATDVMPFPIYDLDEWSKNLVKLIESTPNSRVIESNSFEYVDGAYPDRY